MKSICNKSKSALVANVSNNIALIATNKINNPFEHADVITFSTSGGFRGPKGSIIVYKVGSKGIN